MYTELLRYKKLIEVGNLTKAAEELYISQPALSLIIKRLEKRYGAQLVVRSRTGIKPTAAGNTLYEYAVDQISLSKNLEAKIASLHNTIQNSLSIGLIDSVAEAFINKSYTIAQRTFSDTQLDLEISRTDELLSQLVKGNLDFCIGLNKTNYSQTVTKKDFVNEKLYLIRRRGLQLDKEKNIKFVAYNKGSNTHKVINEQLKSMQFTPQYIYYVSSPKLILKLVETNDAYAILPKGSIEHSKSIEILNEYPFSRELCLYYLKTKILSPLEKEILDMVEISMNNV